MTESTRDYLHLSTDVAFWLVLVISWTILITLDVKNAVIIGMAATQGAFIGRFGGGLYQD